MLQQHYIIWAKAVNFKLKLVRVSDGVFKVYLLVIISELTIVLVVQKIGKNRNWTELFEFWSAIGGGAAWTRRLFFRLQFSGSSFKLNFQTLDIKLEGSSVNLKTFQHKETSITITSSGNASGLNLQAWGPEFPYMELAWVPSEVRLYLNRAATLLYSTYYLMSYMPYKRPTLPVIVSVLTATNSYTVHRLTLSWVACVTRETAVYRVSVKLEYTVRSP